MQGFAICIGLAVVFCLAIMGTARTAEQIDAERHDRPADHRNGAFGWLLGLFLGFWLVVGLCWLFGVGTVVRGVGRLVGLP